MIPFIPLRQQRRWASEVDAAAAEMLRARARRKRPAVTADDESRSGVGGLSARNHADTGSPLTARKRASDEGAGLS